MLLAQSQAGQRISRAEDQHATVGLKGSDHKDVFGSLVFTAAGAEVDSSLETVAEGSVLVAAPLSKRLALSYISRCPACCV